MTIFAKALASGAGHWDRDSAWRQIFDRLAVWRRRRATRRALHALDERMLYDVGIHPDDAKREAAKPFWQS